MLTKAQTVLDTRSEAALIQGVRDCLIEAVRVRLRADVPVGVYLSGGIDSSVIAGIVTHLVNEQGQSMGSLPATDRVSCFSVAFENTSGFDESGEFSVMQAPSSVLTSVDIATRTSEFLGVKQYKQIMTEDAFAERFEDATWHCEHHNPDLNFVGKFALSERPRELGFKVVLTGEGADETMTGYQVFLPDVLREPDLTWSETIPEADRLRLFETSEEETSLYYQSIGADFNMSETRQKLNGISTLAAMTSFVPNVYDTWTSQLKPEVPEDVIVNDVRSDIVRKMQNEWYVCSGSQRITSGRRFFVAIS